MATLGNSQDEEEEELTVPETLANDKIKGKMGLLNLCVLFTCYFLLRNFYASMF